MPLGMLLPTLRLCFLLGERNGDVSAEQRSRGCAHRVLSLLTVLTRLGHVSSHTEFIGGAEATVTGDGTGFHVGLSVATWDERIKH